MELALMVLVALPVAFAAIGFALEFFAFVQLGPPAFLPGAVWVPARLPADLGDLPLEGRDGAVHWRWDPDHRAAVCRAPFTSVGSPFGRFGFAVLRPDASARVGARGLWLAAVFALEAPLLLFGLGGEPVGPGGLVFCGLFALMPAALYLGTRAFARRMVETAIASLEAARPGPTP